jgi:hypothetical protein
MEYRKSEEAKSHEVREQLDAITQEVMDAKVDKVLASDKVKKSLTRKILKA